MWSSRASFGSTHSSAAFAGTTPDLNSCVMPFLAALGVAPDDIAVVSKHDTSTNANDPNESELHNTLARRHHFAVAADIALHHMRGHDVRQCLLQDVGGDLVPQEAVEVQLAHRRHAAETGALRARDHRRVHGLQDLARREPKSGVRPFADGMGADYRDGTDEEEAEVYLDRDVSFTVPTRAIADEYVKMDEVHTSIAADAESGEWTVTRHAGSMIRVPRRRRRTGARPTSPRPRRGTAARCLPPARDCRLRHTSPASANRPS